MNGLGFWCEVCQKATEDYTGGGSCRCCGLDLCGLHLDASGLCYYCNFHCTRVAIRGKYYSKHDAHGHSSFGIPSLCDCPKALIPKQMSPMGSVTES